LDLQQPVPITIKVVSSNPVYAIQHYVVKFVSDLRQVDGFVLILSTSVSSTNKTDRHDIIEILLKVALNTIKTKPLTIWTLCICITPRIKPYIEMLDPLLVHDW
jgi:hypothetical protein